jgi:hypothetical protein
VILIVSFITIITFPYFSIFFPALVSLRVVCGQEMFAKLAPLQSKLDEQRQMDSVKEKKGK